MSVNDYTALAARRAAQVASGARFIATISLPGTLPGPDARFSHVHLDVVGPSPLSNGFNYLFTGVNRYTHWAEAIPLPNVQAETIVKAFVNRWVATFGAPSTVTIDRAAQFESELFNTLLESLGYTRSLPHRC
ncbi:unnamed protein product [Dibothriocephalus latus]|uniref:Integrase catalytic domain-containing protein n=1 Tax=Dibothriocephalus latus TaxID=60516 RepID=A0A3P7N701_DIBLA|nr:unnamed protein product [Dibothriocephalus latus]